MSLPAFRTVSVWVKVLHSFLLAYSANSLSANGGLALPTASPNHVCMNKCSQKRAGLWRKQASCVLSDEVSVPH